MYSASNCFCELNSRNNFPNPYSHSILNNICSTSNWANIYVIIAHGCWMKLAIDDGHSINFIHSVTFIFRKKPTTANMRSTKKIAMLIYTILSNHEAVFQWNDILLIVVVIFANSSCLFPIKNSTFSSSSEIIFTASFIVFAEITKEIFRSF